MNGILILFNFLLVCFESIMAAYLSDCFFERRYSRTAFVLATCILAGLSNLIFAVWGSTPIIKLIFGITLHAIWICVVFRTNIVKAVFTAALLLSFWVIVDNLLLMCISLFSGNNSTSVWTSPYAYYLMCFGAKIIELLAIAILGVFSKRKFQPYTLSWTEWLRTLFFPLTALFVSLELLHIYYKSPESASELSICACILLLADVMSIFLLDHLEKQQIAIRNSAIWEQDLKIERESISSWVSAYREERKQSHDFQNQLSVLRGLVEEHAEPEQFLKYLDSLLNIKLPATRYIDTNRPVADVVLSQKSAIAINKDISFQMQLDDLSQFPLPDDELVVVLSNLLDNAIEACELISNKDLRYILIKIQYSPAVTYLHVENSTATPVTIKNNHIVSHKKVTGHGYGLQNIRTILERHQSLYTLSYQEDDMIFCFSAQILPS